MSRFSKAGLVIAAGLLVFYWVVTRGEGGLDAPSQATPSASPTDRADSNGMLEALRRFYPLLHEVDDGWQTCVKEHTGASPEVAAYEDANVMCAQKVLPGLKAKALSAFKLEVTPGCGVVVAEAAKDAVVTLCGMGPRDRSPAPCAGTVAVAGNYGLRGTPASGALWYADGVRVP